MATITVRIPSKKVPYGFLEFQQEVPSLDPQGLAEMYVQLIKDYQAAEVAAFEAAPKAAPKQEDKSVDEAVKILDEGLGGVEEIDENAPVKPWDKASDTETEEKKPWAAEDGDWDFS
jgi:hypothetical protein